MKLSDAIRLGSMMRPKALCSFVNEHGTCALGAGLEAVGQLDAFREEDDADDAFAVAMTVWPWLGATDQECPVCGMTMWHQAQVITHINDTHEWTRERIADFVQSLEEPASVPAIPNPLGEPASVTAR